MDRPSNWRDGYNHGLRVVGAENVVAFLRSVTYKEGWRWSADLESPKFDKIRVRIDVFWPDAKGREAGGLIVSRHFYMSEHWSREQMRAEFADQVRGHEMHEMHEWLKFDGEYFVEPH